MPARFLNATCEVGIFPHVPIVVDHHVNPGAFMVVLEGDTIVQTGKSAADRYPEFDKYADVLAMANQFERITTAEQAVDFLQSWGNLFTMTSAESDSDFAHQNYSERIPMTCFRAWQNWFLQTRIDPQADTPAMLDELFPTEGMITHARLSDMFLRRRPFIRGAEGDDEESLALSLEGSSVLETLGSVIFAEMISGTKRRLCPNCKQTFAQKGKRNQIFCEPNCGLRYHKRAWARTNSGKGKTI